jgi:CarD family transcriptional regulator
MELAVGDRLVYPNQGLCTVTEIKAEEIAGQKLTFVSLIMAETAAKVKVPQAKLEKNGVRRLANTADVKKVFDYLKSDAEKASLDWKKRARDNVTRLTEGGLMGLAEILKGLQVLSELRPLPPKERDLYNDARHLFVEELAAAANIFAADAEDALDVALYPVGKDRPKRSAEEFKLLVGGDEDDLGLGELMLDEATPEEPEAESEAESEEESDGDEKPKKKVAKEPRASKAAPAKSLAAPVATKAKKGVKSLISDLEVTAPAATALSEIAMKKRGRPAAVKPAPPPTEPKKRGRPTKAKPESKPEAKPHKKSGKSK